MGARRLMDISPRISPNLEVWDGDTRFSSRRVMDMGAGGAANVTTITTTVQLGAHVDAPLHFDRGGEDVASVPLEAFVGPARVVRLQRAGAILEADVASLDGAGVERLLLCTRRAAGPPAFADPFAWLDPAAARALAATGLRLFGIDSFSVDARDSKVLASHHALRAGGCSILEGLELWHVPAGDYELIALPLPLAGCDASPVRAVLRDLA